MSRKYGEFQKVVLQPGEKINRFGHDHGYYFGEIGDSKEMRSMSPNSDFENYSAEKLAGENEITLHSSVQREGFEG